jgi:hypothetical protein
MSRGAAFLVAQRDDACLVGSAHAPLNGVPVAVDTVAKLFVSAQFKLVGFTKMSMKMEFSSIR